MLVRLVTTAGALATGALLLATPAAAQPVKTVFVISMENTNWAQNGNQFTGGQQQIYQNPAAPFLNALVNGTATLIVNGVPTNISTQTAFATHYHNVLASPTGNGRSHSTRSRRATRRNRSLSVDAGSAAHAPEIRFSDEQPAERGETYPSSDRTQPTRFSFVYPQATFRRPCDR